MTVFTNAAPPSNRVLMSSQLQVLSFPSIVPARKPAMMCALSSLDIGCLPLQFSTQLAPYLLPDLNIQYTRVYYHR